MGLNTVQWYCMSIFPFHTRGSFQRLRVSRRRSKRARKCSQFCDGEQNTTQLHSNYYRAGHQGVSIQYSETVTRGTTISFSSTISSPL